MVAKRLAIALCALSFLQTSFAGFERFGFSKDANTQVNETWDALSDDEQRALIQRYQSLKEAPKDKKIDLQQRMDWFTQLPEQEKQKCEILGKNEYSRTQRFKKTYAKCQYGRAYSNS